MFYLLKLYLFLFLIFLQQCSANVIECEGFVKSAVQINLSDIKVKLFTSQGNLKYEAECNPQNGYFLRGHFIQPFLIPIYNKGKYLVEIDAADGYVFEPELYEIEIGNNGGCSEELNFNLAGLKISGKILDGEDSSLVLGLFKQEDGELVEKTIIDKKGKYNFVAWPGKYVISPFSGSTKCLNQDKMEIEVGTTPLTIKPDLQIEGYSLEVNVVDEKGDPFLSTNVVLQSDKQIKFENLPLSAEQPITFNEGQNWFYKFNTNSSGSTLINCLPPGKYVVNAEQKVLNYVEAVFDRKSIVMKSTTANKVTISVKTFNIDGIVLTSQQIPFKHVAIYLNGKFKTMSGRDGKFMVTNVSPGRHLFEAEKEHFEFNILYNIDISSKTKEGITFFPTRVSVCGQLFLCDNVQTIEFTTPDEYYIRFSIFDGTFCKMLSPEKYTVKLISANILPNQIEIDLKRGPIFNLLFVNQTKFLTTDEKGLLTENMKDALTVVSSWTSLLSIMLNLSALYLVIAGLFIANLYYLWNRR